MSYITTITTTNIIAYTLYNQFIYNDFFSFDFYYFKNLLGTTSQTTWHGEGRT